jgi:Family of unknown function (DUF6879)
MQPPTWALEGSTRLNLKEFGACFASAWAELESRFLKLECWQSYFEAEGNQSQEAFNRGDVSKVRELLQQEAEADRPLYDGIRRRGIDYARIRLVQEPFTPYLEYELMSYRIRAAMGENIEVVRCEPAIRLPNEQYFDFLLFDQRTALIHDYGETGRQSGGWLTQDASVIARLAATARALRGTAISLERFVADR